MKIKLLKYQRNGVGGIGFFEMCYTDPNAMKNVEFIATFETNTDERTIKWDSCRVITPQQPDLDWRGDRIAGDIQKYLISKFGEVECFYDYIDLIKNNETH